MPGPLPVIDVWALVHGGHDSELAAVARRIDRACRDDGFFFVVGHGVDRALREELDELARTFFALDDAEKSRISMDRGGRAWRGWFPVGGELTSGRPDRKEGLYFGAELGAEDPRVQAERPLHGPNLFPEAPAALRPVVLSYMEAMTSLGHALVGGLSLALGLDRNWFDRHLTAEPLTLFRVFRYPPTAEAGMAPDPPPPAGGGWGVGEHTDYGLLTILGQDRSGGLEVRTRSGWVDAPPVPDAFVCNLGDMIDRMTRGHYRSTPHRVRSTSADRLSFPFFFDPGWDADVRPIPLDGPPPDDDVDRRWDTSSVHAFEGTYGDYLRTKLARVFPDLGADVLDPGPEGGGGRPSVGPGRGPSEFAGSLRPAPSRPSGG